jgi:hypothetical protein
LKSSSDNEGDPALKVPSVRVNESSHSLNLIERTTADERIVGEPAVYVRFGLVFHVCSAAAGNLVKRNTAQLNQEFQILRLRRLCREAAGTNGSLKRLEITLCLIGVGFRVLGQGVVEGSA